MTDNYFEWIARLRDLTATAELANSFRDRRYAFADRIGNAATQPIAIRPIKRVVYGVWLCDHDEPAYVGQTSEAERRLYDLPIGESHHLANTYPPEIWQKLVIVDWMAVLGDAQVDDLASAVAVTLPDSGGRNMDAIGQGFEHLLQIRFAPHFNLRRRKRPKTPAAGTWDIVKRDRSMSLGARASSQLSPAFEQIVAVWEVLDQIAPEPGRAEHHIDGGRVVFPQAMLFAAAHSRDAAPQQ